MCLVYFISHLVSELFFCDTSYIAYFVSFLLFPVLDIIHLTEGPFFCTVFCAYDLCDNSTEEAYSHIKLNNETSRNIPRTTYILRGKVLVFCLVVHCIIVWLTGTKYFIELHSKFTVVLTFCGQAMHSITKYMHVDHCSRFFRQWRTGHVQKQVVGEESSTPRAVISGCFPSRISVAREYTGVEDAPFLSIYLLVRVIPRYRLHFLTQTFATGSALHVRNSRIE